MIVPEATTYRNPRHTDWTKFGHLLSERVRAINLIITEPKDLDASVDQFNYFLNECYFESCPVITLCTNRNNKWWNNDLVKMRQELRKEQRKAKRSNGFNRFYALKTDYSKAIQKAKNESWKRTVSELENMSATSKMYNRYFHRKDLAFFLKKSPPHLKI